MIQVRSIATTMIVALIVAGSLPAQECTGGKCGASVLPAIASKIRLMSTTPGFPYRVYISGDGVLVLVHNLNPRQVDIAGMTHVALLMASAARHETRRFASVVGTMSHASMVEP